MTTALEPEELLAEVRLPLLPAQTRWGFYEFNRRAGDFAMGMALVAFEIDRRRHRRAARRRRRRRGRSAPDRGGGSAARRPPSRCGRIHGSGGGCRGRHRSLDRRTDRRRLPPRTRRHGDAPRAGAGRIVSLMMRAATRNKYIGQSVPRLEDPPLVTRARPFCRRHLVSAPASHAARALADRAWQDRRRSTPRRRARCRGSSRCGPRRHRRRAADRFPRRPHRAAGAVPPAGARDATGCAMSASPSPPCSPSIPTSPRMPPTSSRSRSPNCRCCSTPMRSPANSRPAATPSRPSSARAMATSTPCSRAPHPVVELDLAVGRHSGVPLETRGAIGRYDASRDILELHGAAKVPHRNRDLLARMLGRSPSSIHVHEAHVGGGFGIRGELYPEDVLVCVAAMRLGAPGEMDRGPPRASRLRQSLAPAAPQDPRRARWRRPHPRPRRRVLARPGRLCAHPRDPRRR